MDHTSTHSFESLMTEGHRALQSERNQEALDLFKKALYETDGDDEKNVEAILMQAIARRKLGDFTKAISAFMLANTFATTDLQRGVIHRDLGMAYLDKGDPEEATLTLHTSYQCLNRANELIEASVTYGFQGRVLLRTDDVKKAREVMRQAAHQLKHSPNPVYSLNNLIWLMLASPIRRWLLLPEALWLVIRYRPNRTVGALARVLTSLGGIRLYDVVRAKKSR